MKRFGRIALIGLAQRELMITIGKSQPTFAPAGGSAFVFIHLLSTVP